jgi:protease-4
MKRNSRMVSALLRHDWLIEETYARAHESLINAYLSGQLAHVDEEDKKPIGYYLGKSTGTKGAGHSGIAIANLKALDAGIRSASGGRHTAQNLVRYEIESDTELPDNSVFILDIRGPIFKEGSCFSYGTEDYVQQLKAAFQNPKIVGVVLLVDSPGGQLSGTPTLYDVIRTAPKPTISLVNEGLMASAAYWLACGSSFIYATQQTDQIGSIGVFVQLRDSSAALEKAGVRNFAIYSDRSPDKNRPFREALEGKPELLKAELNQAADFFWTAVQAGRGERLKPATKDVDVSKGGLFYAGEAIKYGLIDGYGDLQSCVDKVYELAEAAQNQGESSALASAITPDSFAQQPAPAASGLTEETTPIEGATLSDSQPNQPHNDMFGDKHKKITALVGREATSITDDELNDINADLDTQNIKGVRIVSAAYLQEAQEAIAGLTAANTKVNTLQGQITTLTEERDTAVSKATEFGSQPGHLGSKTPKEGESLSTGEENQDPFYSETDAKAAALRAQIVK